MPTRLAEAFNLRNMKRDAVKHYRRFLALVPDGPDAVIARKMIEELSRELESPTSDPEPDSPPPPELDPTDEP